MASGIYQIRNTVNGKVYIGSAVNIKKRWGAHLFLLAKGSHHSPHLRNAWKNDGAAAFVWEILELVPDKSKLIAAEQKWIDRARSYDDVFGYNISRVAGSKLGLKHTPEARAKIAAGHAGRYPTQETRAKMSAAHAGRRPTAAHRAALSVAAKGRICTPEQRARLRSYRLGKPRSPEATAKTTAANLGRKNTPEAIARMTGKKHTPEAIARMTGRKRSPETLASMAAAQQRRRAEERRISAIPKEGSNDESL
jgi:group I intron endonuclease